MADNLDVAQSRDVNHNRILCDITTAVELKGINNTLAEIKEDIKKVEKHDREILDLQYQFSAQQKSIEALTRSINDLTSTVSNVAKTLSDQVAALSLKLFTGVAWLGGGVAVITVLWTLVSSGLLHFGAGTK